MGLDKEKVEKLKMEFPRMGMRWSEEEDIKLRTLYEEFLLSKSVEFDKFLLQSTEVFGRRSNGILGRLAKYFPNIPGWDYESVKQRDEERKQKKMEEAVMNQMDKSLSAEKKSDEPFVNIEFAKNPSALEALKILEDTHENLFLTGEAGTGKSTLLKYFRQTTKKKLVVLAPTGVAALNVSGQTIHSFCAFGLGITLAKVKKLAPRSPKFLLLQKIDTIIVDEISMVRADLLDCLEKFLRLNGPAPSLPFGGLQMVFIGDLHQLPPVEDRQEGAGLLFKQYDSQYFFDSTSFRNSKFRFVQLKHIYRQQDTVFIEALNGVRNNNATEEHLEVLNKRAQNEDIKFKFEKFAIYLTPTNFRANQVNTFFLQRLDSELKIYQGSASGSFEDRQPPTDLNMQLKVGAQIMMLNNDKNGRWVNGTMGKILRIEKGLGSDEKDELSYSPSFQSGGRGGYENEYDFDFEEGFKSDYSEASLSDPDVIIVELENGEIVEVLPHTWEMYQFVLNKSTQSVDSKTTGTFTQYPFKLAWAVTIHKAQGKTFDKVYVDLASGTFAHGQLYVALSRCRSLKGLFLRRPITKADIILDQRVVNFLENFK